MRFKLLLLSAAFLLNACVENLNMDLDAYNLGDSHDIDDREQYQHPCDMYYHEPLWICSFSQHQ